jgi:hypothetical protein
MSLPRFQKAPARKGICPQCNHKRVFRYYQNFPEEFGKCERINKCGYHRKPVDYTNAIESDWKPAPEPKTIDLHESIATQYLGMQNTPFHTYCINDLRITEDHLIKWGVGGKQERNTTFTAFIQQTKTKTINVKLIEYNERCKRTKNGIRHEKAPNPETKYGRCLFGAHLLEDEKIICLVESEKTAVISSSRYPNYNWLATGGNNAFTSECALALQGFKVVYLNDADKAGRESIIPNILERTGIAFEVLDLFPSNQDGFDIADAIIEKTPIDPSLEYRIDKLSFASCPSIHSIMQTDSANKLRIEKDKLILYLESKGFGTIKMDGEYSFVQITNNTIKRTDEIAIRLFIRAELVKSGKGENEFLKVGHTIVTSQFLHSLKSVQPILHSDNLEKTYLYFKNIILEITKDGFSSKKYSEIDGLVWHDQISSHEFDPSLHPRSQADLGKFSEFIFCICEGEEKRIKSLRTIIGYLINRSFTLRKAILFLDANETNSPEGRTGKTLLCKALGFVRKSCLIDAKVLDERSPFRFQMVDKATHLVILDDLNAQNKFSIESLFPTITGGMQVEKKNKTPFQKDVKLVLTSNRSIQINGGSARDRVMEFEFMNYFNEHYSPFDHFGSWLFEDWSNEEWNLFYIEMIICAKTYLSEGLIPAPPIFLADRKIIDGTSGNTDMLDFFSSRQLSTEYSIKSLIASFKAEYPGYEKLAAKTFAGWIKICCANKGLIHKSRKSNGETIVHWTYE